MALGRPQARDTFTFASEDAFNGDPEYKNTIDDLEDQAQRNGWLSSSGAFDKADLLYLRDFSTALRRKESELEDRERAAWERERALVEAETAAAAAAAPVTVQRAGSSGGGGGLGSGLLAELGPGSACARRGGAAAARDAAGHELKPAPMVVAVKVRPAGAARQGSTALSPTASAAEPLKRRDGVPAHASELEGKRTRVQSDAAHAATRPCVRLRVAMPTSCTAPPAAAPGASGAEPIGGAGRGALPSLLGDYGSESESDGERGGGPAGKHDAGNGGGTSGAAGGPAAGSRGPADTAGAGRAVVGPQLPPPVALMSAEALLTDPSVLAGGVLAPLALGPAAVAGGDAWRSDESASEDDEV